MTDVHALQDAEQRAKIERHVRKNGFGFVRPVLVRHRGVWAFTQAAIDWIEASASTQAPAPPVKLRPPYDPLNNPRMQRLLGGSR